MLRDALSWRCVPALLAPPREAVKLIWGVVPVQPLFAAAGQTCNDASLQGSFEACKSGNIGAEYCIWCNSSHSVHKRCLTRCEPPTVGVATGRFSDRTA